MPEISFDSKISLGHIVTVLTVIIGLIVSGSVGTAQFRDGLDRANAQIDELKRQSARQDVVNARDEMVIRSIEDVRERLKRMEMKIDETRSVR